MAIEKKIIKKTSEIKYLTLTYNYFYFKISERKRFS